MSLEFNKVLGAGLLAGVIAMGAGYTSKILTGGFGHHGAHHGDDHGSGLAKVISIPEVAHGDKKAAKAEAVLEPVTALLASADLAKGEKLTKKCTACHTFVDGGPAKTGPNLYNIVTRQIASAEGFAYSKGLKEKAEEAWTFENLNGFLNKPKKWAPGTKMVFAGFKKVEDRANMIAYLRSLSASPAPIE